ncbi:unnamed protein product [Pleuronectes platessa]|uniref:Uncharacterized protein n=1 Tax=Pleuronectes platessa TaxID=8262 RepID=A0A9N7UAT4_PLEPL|nr:unnamed protein product [Pleuronectes platessa]
MRHRKRKGRTVQRKKTKRKQIEETIYQARKNRISSQKPMAQERSRKGKEGHEAEEGRRHSGRETRIDREEEKIEERRKKYEKMRWGGEESGLFERTGVEFNMPEKREKIAEKGGEAASGIALRLS